MSSQITALADGRFAAPRTLPKSNDAAASPVSLARRNVAGFEISERAYPAGFELGRHRHDTALLIYGLEQTYSETYTGGRTVKCPPGVLRFLPRGIDHANVFENGSRLLLIAIEGATLNRITAHTNTLDRPREIRSVASVWLMQRLCAEFHHDDPLALVSVEGILLEVLAEAARNSPAFDRSATVPRWLRVARDYIESNFLRTLSLAEIARVAGVHRVHLAREFRRYFSTSVGELLRRRRVEHACRLVSTTRDPLADIAIACGFSDQSHFCATFRHHVGVTPGRFREMAE